MTAQQDELRAGLLGLGFDVVRFAEWQPAAVPAEPLRKWLDEGRQADMKWMERTAPKRLDVQQLLPGAKSLILLGVNYWPGTAGAKVERGRPAWAKYAGYSDYHDTMKPALVAAGRLLESLFSASPGDYRYYVDTGPVLERGWAAVSGVGFLGKNAMLISRDFGNWLFLAAILTRLKFLADPPLNRPKRKDPSGASATVGLLCGKCTRCISACPTAAIVEPGVVDARRCISYHTIENKGVIPRALRPGIGNRIYGCDTCLDVCPWNRFARESRRLLLSARPDLKEFDVREILALTADRFAEMFRQTPIKRLKLAGLLRNACIVAANTERRDCLDLLAKLAGNPSPVVRAHAVWAVFALAGVARAESCLQTVRATEDDPMVLAEYEAGRGATR